MSSSPRTETPQPPIEPASGSPDAPRWRAALILFRGWSCADARPGRRQAQVFSGQAMIRCKPELVCNNHQPSCSILCGGRVEYFEQAEAAACTGAGARQDFTSRSRSPTATIRFSGPGSSSATSITPHSGPFPRRSASARRGGAGTAPRHRWMVFRACDANHGVDRRRFRCGLHASRSSCRGALRTRSDVGRFPRLDSTIDAGEGIKTIRTAGGNDEKHDEEAIARYAAALPSCHSIFADMGRYSGRSGIANLTYSLLDVRDRASGKNLRATRSGHDLRHAIATRRPLPAGLEQSNGSC